MQPQCAIESVEDRDALLRYVRSIAAFELGVPGSRRPVKPEIKGSYGGVFVTYWRGEKLRGCVGTFAATSDVARTVAETARASLKDSRFKDDPPTGVELSRITIEISILSEATPVTNFHSIVPGEHGVIVRKLGRTGCFLPKVAGERSWSVETLLANCCTMKAGLAPDAWRDSDTEVLIFTAQVFADLADSPEV